MTIADTAGASHRITVDLTYFPLVIQSILPGHEEADLAFMCEAYDELLQGKRRFANIVYFAPEAKLLSAPQRRRVSEWWTSRKAEIEALNLLSVTVTPSAWVRGALTAIHWFTQPKNPQGVASTVAQAIDMCAATLQDAGLPLSASTLSQVRSRYGALAGTL